MLYNVKHCRKLFVFGFILLISTVSVFSQKFESKLIKLGDIKSEKSNKVKSVLGVWDLAITVAPRPTADNRITFSGEETSGTFVDKNNHKGTWKLEGNKVTWNYTNVPNLKNTFVGVVNDDWTEMKGTNSGTWQGNQFRGTWTGKTNKSSSGKSEVEKWREDLRFIAKELPAKHKDLFHRLDRETFFKEIKELDAKIPTLTKNQVVLEFSRIIGLAKDGHTQFFPAYNRSLDFQYVPISMYMFGDDIYVRKASEEYKDIVGAKVLRVGRMNTREAFARLSPYAQGDNEMWHKEYVPIFMGSPDVLQALGISDSLGRVVYELEKDGTRFTKEVKVLEGKDNSAGATRARIKDWVDIRKPSDNSAPLTLKHPGKRFWYEYLESEKILFVQLNSVLNDENKSLRQFFEEVFDFAGKNEVDKFVLDIRYNGGGNNTLIKPIIRGIIKLDKIDQPGKFFTIIGRQTFSAAQNLTNELENWTNVTFVGEPTGSHVNLYGDAKRYEMPNSKLPVRISELWWQNKHARDERKWTGPHLFAEPKFASYINNIDPAMKAIREYKPLRPLREMAIEAVQKNEVKAFLAKVKERLTSPLYKYQGSEDEINSFGYQLIQIKKLDDAIEVFKLNVELYPESSNVYDSLAESYMLKGNNEFAIKFYKKSLELNPNNNNAKAMLEKIAASKKNE